MKNVADTVKENSVEQKHKIEYEPIKTAMAIEREGSFATLPSFESQASDESRMQPIVFLKNRKYGIGSDSDLPGHQKYYKSVTEHIALQNTAEFLEDATTRPTMPVELQTIAGDMLENLSFIGETEYKEAAKGIGDYWKYILMSEPTQKLLIITGTTEVALSERNNDGESSISNIEEKDFRVGELKSDEYLLDRILATFSEDEIIKYADRLLYRSSDIDENRDDEVKVIVLDDWIIGGHQMSAILAHLNQKSPYLMSKAEINLIVSSRKRIDSGFQDETDTLPIVPIKAYFTANTAKHTGAASIDGAYITGGHSSVDYPFEENLESLVFQMNKSARYEDTVFMPPLANIVRPYRLESYIRPTLVSERTKRLLVHAALS